MAIARGSITVFIVRDLLATAEKCAESRCLHEAAQRFVHQNPPSSQSRRNAIWISPDRGLTWNGPHHIDSTVEDAGYGDVFWDRTNDRLVATNYQGTLDAASLKQYNLTVDLAP